MFSTSLEFFCIISCESCKYKLNSFIGRLFPWYIFTVVDTVGCKLYYCPKQYKRHTHYIKNYFIVYISRIHSLFTWRKLSALRSPCTTRWSYILGPVANLHDFIEDDTWKKIKQFLPIFENNCGVVFFWRYQNCLRVGFILKSIVKQGSKSNSFHYVLGFFFFFSCFSFVSISGTLNKIDGVSYDIWF